MVRSGVMGRHGALLAVAGAAVALRLPFLLAPEGDDEGGYLAVARQWHAGPSLYGHYWVDRPPLLIMLFQLSSALGGLAALRVVGALAAGVAVLGVAEACRHVGGRRAAGWSAAVAAALFASPQLGTVQVNGELLAAPFVAWSIALSMHALTPSRRMSLPLAAFGAGALALSALLVKQNMADPLVFGVVAVMVAWRTGTVRRSDVRRIATAAGAGAASVLLVVGGWTLLRGTSLVAVWDAMYPFRIRAAGVLATVPDPGQAHRASLLLGAWLTSGVLVLTCVCAWTLLHRRTGGPATWGVAATLVWATASMLLGGGFWDHYLVELIVPVATAAGLALSRRDTRGRSWTGVLVPSLAAGAVVAVALVHWTAELGATVPNRGVGVGTAIGAVAAPGDTLVSAVGDPETVESSGLPSPYPYLWTLPAQVDDPRLTRLTGLLEGADAPTWLVAWDRPSFPTKVRDRLQSVVASHYRAIGAVCGHTVLLRVGVVRPVPPPETCDSPVSAASTWGAQDRQGGVR